MFGVKDCTRDMSSASSKFSGDKDDPAGLSHCAQLDVRCYALRRPAACLEYCAAACVELK
jgi:hypothetical protein